MVLPEVKSINNNNSNLLELSLFIPEKLKYFEGHFPKYPVLPGIVQVEWVIHFVKQHLTHRDITIMNIDQLKFTQVILPKSIVNVKIQIENNKIIFQYFNDSATFSNGKIIYK